MWRERFFRGCATVALAVLTLGVYVVLPVPPSKARRLLARLTGGRPMQRYERTGMTTTLPMWRDGYGRAWLAEGAWSSFRVRVPEYDAR